jgi:hypothetical protein
MPSCVPSLRRMRVSEQLNRLYTKPLGVRVSNEGVLTGVYVAYPDMTGGTSSSVARR